jgi:hypothetical protein
MFPWENEGREESSMLNDFADIEELSTADSVGEANRLLDEGWELLGFHPAPPSQGGAFGSPTTIFVMARYAEWDEDLDESDLVLEELEPLPS